MYHCSCNLRPRNHHIPVLLRRQVKVILMWILYTICVYHYMQYQIPNETEKGCYNHFIYIFSHTIHRKRKSSARDSHDWWVLNTRLSILLVIVAVWYYLVYRYNIRLVHFLYVSWSIRDATSQSPLFLDIIFFKIIFVRFNSINLSCITFLNETKHHSKNCHSLFLALMFLVVFGGYDMQLIYLVVNCHLLVGTTLLMDLQTTFIP